MGRRDTEEVIDIMKQILIYGIGKVAEYYWQRYGYTENIIGAIQTEKSVDKWHGIQVYDVNQIANLSFEELWMTNADIETLNIALKNQVPKNKIVICNVVMCDAYVHQNKGVLDITYLQCEAEDYQKTIEIQNRPVLINTMERFLPVAYMDQDENGLLSHHDYVRYAVVELLAEEIKKRNIEGDIAELGVYQGMMSACFNALFPNRKLYLFDTFEGFAETDIDVELSHQYTRKEFAFNGRFSDTSTNLVLDKMKYPEQCIICKGFFPDTIPNYDVQYALVSLDCDLYQPTLEGLRYFYPRLAEGGYIIIHDYNNNERWTGIAKAIEQFESEIGHLCKVPISDRAGSIVITK